jgi:putative ABC transport system permease protein
LEARFPAFLDRHLGTIRNRTGRTVPAREEQRLKLRKVTDIHLHSHTRNELEPNSDIRYLLLFVLIAAFILLIACINFINLSTALAGKRMKEVGLRKVVGANRIQLLIQFFGESVFLALLSMLLALGLVELVSPYFNSFAGGADLLAGRVDLSLLLVAFLVTGLVAFSAERRTKEIGIRKVLSASVPGTRPSKSPRRILLMPCGMNKKNQSR